MTDDEGAEITRLRATAHPVRLRILSLLTGEAMSAAEVSRALDITHANASYHLRLLHEAGELVVESQEKVRGGVAKRYRYDVAQGVGRRGATPEGRLADARATAAEIERRLVRAAPGTSTYNDLETWVPVAAWHRALDLLHEASLLLHDQARPADTPDTVHVSVTTQAFTLAGGLTGDTVRWTPGARTVEDELR